MQIKAVKKKHRTVYRYTEFWIASTLTPASLTFAVGAEIPPK